MMGQPPGPSAFNLGLLERLHLLRGQEMQSTAELQRRFPTGTGAPVAPQGVEGLPNFATDLGKLFNAGLPTLPTLQNFTKSVPSFTKPFTGKVRP